MVLAPTGTLGVALGHQVTISCVGSMLGPMSIVEWFINGTSLELLHNTSEIIQKFERITLLFSNTPVEYNGTRISCRIDGVNSSAITILTIQGIHASS